MAGALEVRRAVSIGSGSKSGIARAADSLPFREKGAGEAHRGPGRPPASSQSADERRQATAASSACEKHASGKSYILQIWDANKSVKLVRTSSGRRSIRRSCAVSSMAWRSLCLVQLPPVLGKISNRAARPVDSIRGSRPTAVCDASLRPCVPNVHVHCVLRHGWCPLRGSNRLLRLRLLSRLLRPRLVSSRRPTALLLWSLRTCQSSRPSNHPTVPQPLVLQLRPATSDCKPLSDYPIKIFSHASRSLRDCSVSQGLKHLAKSATVCWLPS
eukprot:scaffold15081_cov123-Isochrysis_galbana.AAC.2